MSHNEELLRYEGHLVQALLDQPERRQTEPPGSFQVFIGTQSLGALECDGNAKIEKTFTEIPVQELIELRSSSGLLLGSLYSEPRKQKTAEFQAGNFSLRLKLQTEENKGVLLLTAQNLFNFNGISPFQSSLINSTKQTEKDRNAWSMVALAAQLLLLAGVIFLVVDRLYHSNFRMNDVSRIVASQDQQLQKMSQQLLDLQSKLEKSPSIMVNDTSNTSKSEGGIVKEKGLKEAVGDSILAKKPETLEQGLLKNRPVWVRFKKDMPDSRIQEILAQVPTQQSYRTGRWYTLNFDQSNSRTPDLPFKSWKERGDIEIVTTSTVTHRVQVRFRKDAPDNAVNRFFEEIRVKRTKPNNNWYDIDLTLPDSEEPRAFIDELPSKKIIDGIKVDMAHLPSR